MKQIKITLSELTQISTNISLLETEIESTEKYQSLLKAKNVHVPSEYDIQISEAKELLIKQKMKFFTATKMLNQLIEKL